MSRGNRKRTNFIQKFVIFIFVVIALIAALAGCLNLYPTDDSGVDPSPTTSPSVLDSPTPAE